VQLSILLFRILSSTNYVVVLTVLTTYSAINTARYMHIG
jgi:hypothetical protein